ncbi:conserved Plasmodium protein, unknown function [Plasmodium relictum]|uniref:Uncharacterized protein n=1 Tax=Plasmodium relictum TaxID=85471 RepID=A0A1J1H7W1_PLARL|nr:conserved Plasmodium protein, unknown function [Plasmodium relictum]CRG99685.1 conserved Plasmodium protein, unknown function [Plasmodium relictum]
MNSTNEINNDGKINYHHNLRKNRKPRNYDFEYFDESLNKPKCRKKRKKKKTLKSIVGCINKNINSLNMHKLKRSYIKRKYKQKNFCSNGDIIKDRSEYILDKNYYLSHKSINIENPYLKNNKTKKFNLDKNVYLFNSSITLRNNNIKADRICEYLTYKTNTIWKYMGSTVKFKLLNDQQEKYIFLKNMKKHIIFEIIKIAMFALLKVNLNDNNIYTLKFIGMQKTLKKNYDNNNVLLRNSCQVNENNFDYNNDKNSNEKKKSEYKKNNCKTKQENKDLSNSSNDKKYLNFFSTNSKDSKLNINKRLEIKNDILNQGVTVSEILDFVKEKYEKYYENVKQYIVTTLNIYCALNIFKLIRRGRYAICKYDNFNIFKVKYYRKYHKFFYSLKGEEEILMNIKNYLKSFYYDKNKEKNVTTSKEVYQTNKYDLYNTINEKNKIIKKRKKRNVTKDKVGINNINIKENVLDTTYTSCKNKRYGSSIDDIPLYNNNNKPNDFKNNVLLSVKKRGKKKVKKVKDSQTDVVYESNSNEDITEPETSVINNNTYNSLDYCDDKIKNVFIDLNKINIKCIKVVYGMKHFFCSYDTKEKSDKNFEIIKVQKKYDLLRRKHMINMNLRYNFLYNTKRLLNSYCYVNDDCNLTNTTNFFLRNNNIKKEEEKKAPQYGKQKKQNNEDDSSIHEKYNYVNFNLSYKTLRKKMICLRHFTSNSKKDEKCFKQKHEIRIKDKLQNAHNDYLIHTYSINSNFSNPLSNDEFSINFESQCSQKSI